jgi:hypothetical protein
VTVSKTKLTFPRPGNWRYKIEISADGDTNWKLLVDQTRAASSGADCTDLVQGNSVSGRFVRVIIIESPSEQSAALAGLCRRIGSLDNLRRAGDRCPRRLYNMKHNKTVPLLSHIWRMFMRTTLALAVVLLICSPRNHLPPASDPWPRHTDH